MQKFKQFYSDSIGQLRVTQNLVICGLMAALAVVLSYVANINAGPYIKIGFAGIPNRIIEFLFGPVIGLIFGGILDILKYLIKPDGPFFFGFTLDAMLAGVIYGFFLYKKPISLRRCFISEFFSKLIVNCGFNTLWISTLYGKGFFVLLPLRVIKNAVMLPIDTAILFFALTTVKKILSSAGFDRQHTL